MSRRASEDEWIASAARQFEAGDDVVLGIGHDCAAVRFEDIAVVAKDVLVDGVHFRLEECGAAAAARKSLAVNVSDLAAAAAVPVGCLVGVVLPRPADRVLFDALAQGLAEASRAFACPCLGGDTNVADGPLVLSVTVLGRPGPMGVLSREGARPGDVLSVTGPVGGSRLGRHLTFEPRVAAAQALAALRIPHAMIDLSDGLARDLPRLCRASEVGADVASQDVPVHPDVRRIADDRSSIEHALEDGEDFELLLAHEALDPAQAEELAARGVTLHAIGAVTVAERGVRLDGGPWPEGGWDHVALR